MSLVGIDLGIRKIALIVMDHHMIHPFTHEAPADAPRDAQLRQLGMYAHDVCELQDAGSIWIEDTLIGNNVKYSIGLAETKGAVMASLSALRLGKGADIRLVNVSSWKKEVVGRGNADKEAVKNYIVDTHPAYAPLCGDDQDLFDASCVALYGRRILARSRDLKL